MTNTDEPDRSRQPVESSIERLDNLLDPDDVRRQHYEEGRYVQQIAEEIGSSRSAVRDWMDRHDIDHWSERPPEERLWDDPDRLYEYHVLRGLSTSELADRWGTEPEEISHAIDTYGIGVPGGHERHPRMWQAMVENAIADRAEIVKWPPSEEVLFYLVVDSELDPDQVAELYNELDPDAEVRTRDVRAALDDLGMLTTEEERETARGDRRTTLAAAGQSLSE